MNQDISFKNLKQVKPNVFRFLAPVKVIDSGLIEWLSDAARLSHNQSARICFHSQTSDACQRMLVAISEGAGFSPHRQNKESYVTYVMVKGLMRVCLHSIQGNTTESFCISADNLHEKVNSVLELPANVYRSSKALTPTAVFFETCEGPFDDSMTEWLQTD